MAEIRSRAYTEQGRINHERIFGSKKPIDYSENWNKDDTSTQKETKIVDPSGKPIKLGGRTKNAMYSKAKWLREEIRNGLCTKKECDRPEQPNVDKMTKEMSKGFKEKVRQYRTIMRDIIGADPKDYGTEGLRRRGW